MFENATIESRRKPRNVRRLLMLPLSVAIHAGAIALVAFATVWTIELPAATPMQDGAITFGPAPIPAPPPIKGNGGPPQPEKTRVSEPAKPADVTLPRDAMVPDAIPDVTPDMDPAGRGDDAGDTAIPGVPWGVPGGDPEGEPDGIVGGVPSGDPDPEALDPIIVSSGVVAPVIVHRVEPDYPTLAVRMGLQGPVIVRCIIDRRGTVREITVLRSPHEVLSTAAVEAIRQWQFQPGTLSGRPVDVIFNLTVIFDLNRVR